MENLSLDGAEVKQPIVLAVRVGNMLSGTGRKCFKMKKKSTFFMVLFETTGTIT